MNQRQSRLPARLQRWRGRIHRSPWWMNPPTRGRWSPANRRNCQSAGSRIPRFKWPSHLKALGLRPRRSRMQRLLLKFPRNRRPRCLRHFRHLPSRQHRRSPSLLSRSEDLHRRLRQRSRRFPTGRIPSPLLRLQRRCSSKLRLLRSRRSLMFHRLSVPHPSSSPQHLQWHPWPRQPRAHRWTVHSPIHFPSASSSSARFSVWIVK